MLEIKNIHKSFGDNEILKGVDLAIDKGDVVVILGPSGSGKSTIMNILGGIDKATAGELIYRGSPIHLANDRELTTYRRNCVGFVFQFYNLIPNLTARENISLAAELSPSPLKVEELLERIGLAARGDHFPARLSGGEQQRVAIARAVAKNPDLLLCDEPTGALDFTTGIQVLRILKDFNTAYGKTVVIITHNAGIAAMANRVFYIRDGELDRIQLNSNPLSPEEVTW